MDDDLRKKPFLFQIFACQEFFPHVMLYVKKRVFINLFLWFSWHSSIVHVNIRRKKNKRLSKESLSIFKRN